MEAVSEAKKWNKRKNTYIKPNSYLCFVTVNLYPVSINDLQPKLVLPQLHSADDTTPKDLFQYGLIQSNIKTNTNSTKNTTNKNQKLMYSAKCLTNSLENLVVADDVCKNNIQNHNSSLLQKRSTFMVALSPNVYKDKRNIVYKGKTNNYYSPTGVDITRILNSLAEHQVIQFGIIKTNEQTKPGVLVTTLIVFTKLKDCLELMQIYKENDSGTEIISRNIDDNPLHCTTLNISSNEILNTKAIVMKSKICFNKISIQRQQLSLQILITSLQTLSKKFLEFLEDFSKLISEKLILKSQNPSLSRSEWHFKNIAQGYLIRKLLRDINIHTLNAMDKFYFLCNNPNLKIEINFKVKNAIFMAYEDTDISNDTCFEIVISDITYVALLRKSSKIKSINFDNKLQKEELKAIDNEKLIESKHDYWKTSKKYHSKESDVNSDTRVIESAHSLEDESLSFIYLKPDNQNIQYPFARYVDNQTKPKKQLYLSNSYDKTFEIERQNTCNSYDITRDNNSWVSKLIKHSKTIKANFNVNYICFGVNETIFDTFTVENCVQTASDYIEHFSQIFQNPYIKNLGKSFNWFFIRILN